MEECIMKHIILFLAILALPSLSFGHEGHSFRSLKKRQENAFSKMKKIKSKYRVICKVVSHVNVMSDNNKSLFKLHINPTKQERLFNVWFSACRQSKNPSIASVYKAYREIDNEIRRLERSTTIGRKYRKARGEFYSDHLQVKKEDNKLEYFREQWENLTQAQRERKGDLWKKLYDSHNGVCGAKTPDPNVYKAFKELKDTETKCQKIEKKFLKSLHEYRQADFELYDLKVGLNKEQSHYERELDKPTGSVK